jgi:hypothetical protein
VCGLCGNFDGDTTNEFVSPQNVLYPDVAPFVDSYVMSSDSCNASRVTVRYNDDVALPSGNRQSTGWTILSVICIETMLLVFGIFRMVHYSALEGNLIFQPMKTSEL